MKILIASIYLSLGSLFSCQQKGEFKSVSVEEFSTIIIDPDVQRLDVRTVAEYSEAHIPGSININVLGKEFPAIADSLLQKRKARGSLLPQRQAQQESRCTAQPKRLSGL